MLIREEGLAGRKAVRAAESGFMPCFVAYDGTLTKRGQFIAARRCQCAATATFRT
jgi:hypothetical protein